ncbi:phytanoyl-CoA dioxygenase family protein [Kitasatospora sp. NPDC057542]|uniref:phytanoyl-CoA dioxygenase family protein n=1 Tax=Streptomycetaceae TaxID=2062 RepID=UPI001CCCD27B|nr:phytanoyl-CoA dioxygenase family protein [Streptomyces sp. LS1784]
MGHVLSESQLENYRDNGFLVVEGLLDGDLVARARQVVDDLLSAPELDSVAEKEPGDASKARRIWAPTSRDQVFADLAVDARLLDAVADLIGEDLILQYSKLNVKAPHVGSVVEWHQDFAYYPHSNTDLVAALIYLDDATRENACLRVAAGSHKKGLLSHEVDGFFGGKIVSLDGVGVDASTVVDCPGTAGSVVFLHPLVVHASEQNRSDRYRRAFIPAYRATDAFPLYYGPHAAHNEPTAKLVRGKLSKTARSEGGTWRLPIAAAEFNSLFEIQEGAHLRADRKVATGYFSHEVDSAAAGATM